MSRVRGSNRWGASGTCTHPLLGPKTVSLASGRSTPRACTIPVRYTPTPARGRRSPDPSTTTFKPVKTEGPEGEPLPEVGLVPLEHLEVFERETGAPHDRRLRLVRHDGRNPGVHRDVTVDPPELRPAPPQHDAAIEDVSGQLRPRLLAHVAP